MVSPSFCCDMQSFAEFTEFFTVHRCTGRQHFTSSSLASQLFGSLTNSICNLSKRFILVEANIHKPSIIAAQEISARTLFTRFLDDFCLRGIRLMNYFSILINSSSIIIVSR